MDTQLKPCPECGAECDGGFDEGATEEMVCDGQEVWELTCLQFGCSYLIRGTSEEALIRNHNSIPREQ